MTANIFKGKDEEEKNNLEEILENSIEIEEDLMRTYLITAERIHDDDRTKGAPRKLCRRKCQKNQTAY